MTRPLALLLLLAGPVAAQSWPQDTGLQRDGLRGAIEDLGRVRQDPTAPAPDVSLGENQGGSVTGILGGLRRWLGDRAEIPGEDDRGAQRFFEAQRAREAEVAGRLWR